MSQKNKSLVFRVVKVRQGVIVNLCYVVQISELAAVAALLGMRTLVLQRGLSFRTHMSNRGQTSQAPCSAAAVSNELYDFISHHLSLG